MSSSKPRKTIQEGDGDHRHGTQNGYINLRCRCADCREAWRVYDRARNRTRRQRPYGGQAVCGVPGCESPHLKEGLCAACHRRWWNVRNEMALEDFKKKRRPIKGRNPGSKPKRRVILTPGKEESETPLPVQRSTFFPFA